MRHPLQASLVSLLILQLVAPTTVWGDGEETPPPSDGMGSASGDPLENADPLPADPGATDPTSSESAESTDPFANEGTPEERLARAGLNAPESMSAATRMISGLGREVAALHRELETLVQSVETAGRPTELQRMRLTDLKNDLQIKLDAAAAIQEWMTSLEPMGTTLHDAAFMDPAAENGEAEAPKSFAITKSKVMGSLLALSGTILLGVAYLSVEPQMAAPGVLGQLETLARTAFFVGGGGSAIYFGSRLALRGKGPSWNLKFKMRMPWAAGGPVTDALLGHFMGPLASALELDTGARGGFAGLGRRKPMWNEVSSGFQDKAAKLMERAGCAIALGDPTGDTRL